jgi:hypothetical protein
MDSLQTNAFQQLQVLTMLTMVLFLAPSAIPPLRRYGGTLRIVTGVLYAGGGALILLAWYLRG